MVIVLATQKGGSGKSTIAINLADYLTSKNKTIIIDADKQATLSESDFIEQIDIAQHYNNLENTIKNYKKKYKNIIVDVAGKDSKELRSALITADIAIIPFQPSQADLYTLDNVSKIISGAKQHNKKLKSYAMINNASTHKANKRPREAMEFIQDNTKFHVLKTILHTRNAYLDTFRNSKTVFQAKDKKAKLEFNNLIKELSLWHLKARVLKLRQII